VHPIGIHGESDISAVINNENPPRITHALAYTHRAFAKLPGRRMLISKLNELDAGGQESRRHINRRAAISLSRVDYGVETGKYERIC
jgi:hypothetical protein